MGNPLSPLSTQYCVYSVRLSEGGLNPGRWQIKTLTSRAEALLRGAPSRAKTQVGNLVDLQGRNDPFAQIQREMPLFVPETLNFCFQICADTGEGAGSVRKGSHSERKRCADTRICFCFV